MRMVMVITSMGPDSQAGGFAEDRVAALCRQAAVERRRGPQSMLVACALKIPKAKAQSSPAWHEC